MVWSSGVCYGIAAMESFQNLMIPGFGDKNVIDLRVESVTKQLYTDGPEVRSLSFYFVRGRP
jgi:hypothetical protein